MRSKKKGYYVDRIIKKKKNDYLSKNLWTRRSVITKPMIDNNVKVHNGKQFISIKINKNMVGHKLGEFAFSRKIYQYKKGKKK